MATESGGERQTQTKRVSAGTTQVKRASMLKFLRATSLWHALHCQSRVTTSWCKLRIIGSAIGDDHVAIVCGCRLEANVAPKTCARCEMCGRSILKVVKSR